MDLLGRTALSIYLVVDMVISEMRIEMRASHSLSPEMSEKPSVS